MKCHRVLAMTFLALSAWACAGSRANKFYVAVDGALDGDGSAKRPWPSVAFALSQISGPGDTIVVMPGIYHEPIIVDAKNSGSQGSPLIIRSEVKWGARIVGTSPYALKTETAADYVVLDGFECDRSMNVGVYLKGNSNTLRNCWIHNSASVGVSAQNLTGTIIENNLIEYNGQNPQFHHGIYADGAALTIRNNIVRHNAALGMQLYPALKSSKVYNNLVHGHFKTGILVQCAPEGGHNQIFNNTSVENRTALGIYHGTDEIVANNILTAPSGDPIFVDGTVVSDYNLCMPPSKFMGMNGFSAEPDFVDATHKCYWLQAMSPAIGKGTTLYAPPMDFWGDAPHKSAAPDLGAFAYYDSLTLPEARQTWYNGYPYRFNLEPGKDVPDLWAPPAKRSPK